MCIIYMHILSYFIHILSQIFELEGYFWVVYKLTGMSKLKISII